MSLNFEQSISLPFSHSVVSKSLRPRGLQHTRLPCPSPSPRVCSNSCPLSWWCHPAISSSVAPFFFCLQPFPASGSFQMSQFFTSDGQSVEASVAASVLPMNIRDSGLISFRIDWFDILAVQRLSRVFSSTTGWMHQFFGAQPFLLSSSHIHTWLLEKP